MKEVKQTMNSMLTVLGKRKKPNSQLNHPDPKLQQEEEINKILDYNKISVERQSLFRKVNTLLEYRQIGYKLDMLNSLTSLIAVVIYIWSTYNNEPFEGYPWTGINVIFHAFWLFDYIIRFLASNNRKRFLLQFSSLIELASSVPYLILIFIVKHDENAVQIYAPYESELSLALCNLFTIFRVIRLGKSITQYMESEVNKQLWLLVLSIVNLILIMSGVLQWLERYQVQLTVLTPSFVTQFHYYIYFILIVVGTIGYENPFTSSYTRLLIIIIIITSIAIVPSNSSKLVQLLSGKSMYQRHKYKTSSDFQHVVVIGDVSYNTLVGFFTEFFHPDHGGTQKQLVILHSRVPGSHMEQLINQAQYKHRVFYLKGQPTNEADLRRAQLHSALAVFILSNKNTTSTSQNDSKVILQAIVIKKYLASFNLKTVIQNQNQKTKHSNKMERTNNTNKARTRICMQILRPEGKTHYFLSMSKQTKADQVICVEELKQSLLAKSCLCPGLITLLSNLIQSSGNTNLDEDTTSQWMKDYCNGKGFEIYRCLLSSAFAGHTFSSVALDIYVDQDDQIYQEGQSRAVLFALEVHQGGMLEPKVLLNPAQMVLPFYQPLYAYVIAEDQSIANAISLYRNLRTGKQTQKSSTLNQNAKAELSQSKNMARSFSITQKLQNFLSFGSFAKAKTSFKPLNLIKKGKQQQNTQNEERDNDSSSNEDDNPNHEIEMMTNPNLNTIKETNPTANNQILYSQQSIANNNANTNKLIDLDENENENEILNINNNVEQQENNQSWDQMYYMCEKVLLKDVTFENIENHTITKNHIVVGGIPSSLQHFIFPLRSRNHASFLPIVFLHHQPPSEKQWSIIQFFPEIYFVKGSPLYRQDLLRANIKKASFVVIFSPEVSEIFPFLQKQRNDYEKSNPNNSMTPEFSQEVNDHMSKDIEDLLDARTIFKYNAIQKLNPGIYVTTELVNSNNQSFLQNQKASRSVFSSSTATQSNIENMAITDNTLAPNYTSGQVYLSGVMDNLVCQAFYSSSLINVLNLLILGAASTIYLPAIQQTVQTSNLYQIAIPDAFVGHSYAKLFIYLAKHQNITALGLFRAPCLQSGNFHSFVHTNPDPTTLVNTLDKVFILAISQPDPEQSKYWGTPFEDQNISYMQKKKNNLLFAQSDNESDKMSRSSNQMHPSTQDASQYNINLHANTNTNAEQYGQRQWGTQQAVTQQGKGDNEGEKQAVMMKIKLQLEEVLRLHDDIQSLDSCLTNRLTDIMKKVKRTLNSQINEMIPHDIENYVTQQLESDEMITTSSVSSVNQDQSNEDDSQNQSGKQSIK